MMQLVKNELIKLRAQKAYLVLSCLVLALVILVSFFTSVLMTPLTNLMSNGREFISRSAAYEYVVDFIYENPDHPLAGVLRKAFRDPKSDGDVIREQAQDYVDMEMYGYYEQVMAAAQYYDFRDENDLPDWVSSSYQAPLAELYAWRAIVLGMQSGKYTEEMMYYDYYLEQVMYVSFAEFPYYPEYSYDPVTETESYRFYCLIGDEPVECSFAEVVAGLVACLPACDREIERLEHEALTIQAEDYYDAYITELDGDVLEKEMLIAQLREQLRNSEQTMTEQDIADAQLQIKHLQGQIEDCKRQTQAYRYLKTENASPDGKAFAIVNQLLPHVLSLRRNAISTVDIRENTEEFDVAVTALANASEHQIRMLDKALIAIEYAYRNDIMPEGMGSSAAKDTFIGNLSTAAFLISAVTIVLSSMILSREFATGTVRLWVIRPKTRIKLLGSKMITLLIYVVGMMLICFGITSVFALLNHLIDLFFYGESTLFAPVYAVMFGHVIALPAVLEHLWALVVLTLPVLLYAALCMLVSVLTKNGVIGIVLGMLVLMFSSDIQAITLIVANYTGLFGYVLQATVMPYLSMDTLLGSALDYSVVSANSNMGVMGLLDLLDLKGMMMASVWGAMPYVCSSLVGVIVLLVHIALLVLLSLLAFRKTQIKS